MKISLREINMDNFVECIRLEVAPAQQGFVAKNVLSLAEAKADGVSQPFAVYAEEQMVGFIMYDFEPKEHRGYITRLMIDQRFQGKGYGREAMRQAIDRLRAIPECRELQTGYMPGNDAARHDYEGFGFEKAAVDDDGEIILRMQLASSA